MTANNLLVLAESAVHQPKDKQQPIEAIIERVKGGETNALLELGSINDPTVIHILEKYVSAGGPAAPESAERQFAGEALGKLGAEKHYEALIKQAQAEDTFAADTELLRLFQVLSYIPTKAAVRTVAQFLDDTSVRKQHADDVRAMSVRVLAVDALTRMAKAPSQVIVDPPAPTTHPYYTPEDVEKWQKWWESHKSKYEDKSGLPWNGLSHLSALPCSQPPWPRAAVTSNGVVLITAIDRLLQSAQTSDTNAILELGQFGNGIQREEVVAVLEGILQKSEISASHAAGCAQMALARLGDTNRFNQIVAELRASDPAIQFCATEKLAYVWNNAAVRALGPCLFDTQYATARVSPSDGRIYEPLSYMAMRALASFVILSPPTPRDPELTPENLQKWRDWWETRKEAFSR